MEITGIEFKTKVTVSTISLEYLLNANQLLVNIDSNKYLDEHKINSDAFTRFFSSTSELKVMFAPPH